MNIRNISRIPIHLFVFSFLSSCSKDSDIKSSTSNQLILTDYIVYYDRLAKGEQQKFDYNGQFSNAFSFYNNKTKKISFSVYSCSMCSSFTLNMNKSDSGIIIGKIYTNNNILGTIDFTNANVSGATKSATKTELKFTKFQDPGLIEGSIKSYMNSTLWCEATFSFSK